MKNFIKQFIPPVIKNLRDIGKKPYLEYVPNAWDIPHSDYNEDATTDIQIKKYHRVLSELPPYSHNGVALDAEKTSFQIVALIAAWGKQSIKILDFGGSLGFHYHFIKQVLPPGFPIDYHIVELPKICGAGRRVNPEVHFHENNIPLGEFDLVVTSGAMQFVRHWEKIFNGFPRAPYFFLSKIPMTKTSGYTARQNIPGQKNPLVFEVRNVEETKKNVEQAGYALVREFVTCPPLDIVRAPSPALFITWLFKLKN